MNMQDIKQAEDTLTSLMRTFRAVDGLLKTLDTVKEGVQFVSLLEDKKAIAQSNLDAVNGALGKARVELAAAIAEAEKINKASAAVKAELSKLGIK